MKKQTIKNILSCVAFCAIVVLLILRFNDILIEKQYNRYYMLEKRLEQLDETYDVQVFGSCHSYTSFHSPSFEENTGISAFDLGNPGEIIPTTYLRMLEQFKKDVPKVALVETWGLNAYETYSSSDSIFDSYFSPNIERLPISLEKLEVIDDYTVLDRVLENFPIAKYKDRILNQQLTQVDFDYSFDKVSSITTPYTKEEMKMRLENNGFCVMPMWLDSGEVHEKYIPFFDVSDYDEQQPDVGPDEMMAFEEDIVKYVDKIVALCEEHNVELIFYRAPYVSTENELKKANWFSNYCKEKDISFYDLEKELSFVLETDFLDYHHLNEAGAKKATDYLTPYILDAIEK